ncbi:MAG: response regulator [Gammaproteobacteria bacterium]|nr:response regulator [Gammaproteobacteria bacterium]
MNKTIPQTLLIVDDDPKICLLLQDFLSMHGFRVITATDGQQMQKKLKEKNFDLIILDLMLPGEDGLHLCRKIRETSSIPIIMLSAIGSETDRIVGLEMGADDYLAKPFNPRELLARIKALLRRASNEVTQAKQSIKKLPILRFHHWLLDQNKRCLLAKDGLIIPLSTGEFELLLAFLEHPEHTLTRDQLLDLTRGKEASPIDRSIDVQVGRLRKKIEDDPKKPTLIVTVRGGGYQLNAQVEQLS